MHIVSSNDICDSTYSVVLYYEISAAIKYYKVYTSNIDYLLAESKLHSRKVVNLDCLVMLKCQITSIPIYHIHMNVIDWGCCILASIKTLFYCLYL